MIEKTNVINELKAAIAESQSRLEETFQKQINALNQTIQIQNAAIMHLAQTIRLSRATTGFLPTGEKEEEETISIPIREKQKTKMSL